MDTTRQASVDVRRYPCSLTPLTVLNELKKKDAHRFISAGSTAVELGHPSGISVCSAMATRTSGILTQSRVTLIGRELNELSVGRHSVALIIMVHSNDDPHKVRQVILKKLSSLNDLRGCMVRISVGKIWLRFSKGALDSGLTFQIIGEYLLSQIKVQGGGFENAELIWTVGKTEQTREIKEIVARLTREKSDRLTEKLVKNMSCETGLSCEECPENDTCQVLKDAVAMASEKHKTKGKI